MTATMERPVQEASAPSLAELPNSHEIAADILERARPLVEDEDHRESFYGEMDVVRTPLDEVDSINGATILVKNECLQSSRSYKIRGATNAVLQTNAHTVVSYSTGNHGRSLLEAATRRGKHTILEVTTSISAAKEQPLIEGNADLHYHDSFRQAQDAATARRGEPGVEVIDPFGHKNVIAGQCSVGYEIVEDLVARGLTHSEVIIPVSTAGAGHLCGVALPVWHAKKAGVLGPNVKVVAVQPENTDTLGRAVKKIQAGEEAVNLFKDGEFDSDCDALAIREESLSPLTLAIAADPEFVDGFVTIDKLSLAHARQYTSSQVGTEVEPAAALPMAYALQHAAKGRTFVLPITGNNTSPETLRIYDELVDAASRFEDMTQAERAEAVKHLPNRDIEFPEETYKILPRFPQEVSRRTPSVGNGHGGVWGTNSGQERAYDNNAWRASAVRRELLERAGVVLEHETDTPSPEY